MNAIAWTVEQLERMSLIKQLYESADPGTFVDLELLTLAELTTLHNILFEDDVA